MSNVCSVCDLDARTRKLAETLLREGVPLRDVTDFLAYWLNRELAPGETTKKVSKSSLDRHKAHFVMEEQKPLSPDAKFTTVEDIAQEMVRRYGSQLEDLNWLPAGKDVREWAALMGKLHDLEQRRKDQRQLEALMAGAIFQKPKQVQAVVIDVPALTAPQE